MLEDPDLLQTILHLQEQLVTATELYIAIDLLGNTY
jgi:hypothetical protein